MNKLGYKVFLSDLKALQDIDSISESMTVTTQLYNPIDKSKRWLYSLISNWALVVGISFFVLTVKILIENLMSK